MKAEWVVTTDTGLRLEFEYGQLRLAFEAIELLERAGYSGIRLNDDPW